MRVSRDLVIPDLGKEKGWEGEGRGRFGIGMVRICVYCFGECILVV